MEARQPSFGLADTLTPEEETAAQQAKTLCLVRIRPDAVVTIKTRAVRTGQFAVPNPGEWFLDERDGLAHRCAGYPLKEHQQFYIAELVVEATVAETRRIKL